MIKANKAIEIATTKEMNSIEKRFFDLLCIYTDFCIKNFFDGKKVTIDLERAEVRTNDPIGDGDLSKVEMTLHGKYHNPVTGSGRMPWWRQEVVIKNWIESYTEGNWKITSLSKKEHIYWIYCKYEFEPNLRDIKLGELGIKD